MAERRVMVDHSVPLVCSGCGHTEVVLQRLELGHRPVQKIIIQPHECPVCKQVARVREGRWFPSYKGEKKP